MKLTNTSTLALLVCLATVPLATTTVFAGGGGGGGDNDVPNGISFRNRATVKPVMRSTSRYEARADYPTFRSQSMTARYAGWQERLDAQRDVDLNSRQFDMDTRGMVVRRKYTSRTTPTLVYDSPGFISMRRDSSMYRGDMGMDSRTVTRNYGIVDGRPQRLTLGNFYRSGSDYRMDTETKILDKLRQSDTAVNVSNGRIKRLTDAQLNNFVTDGNGMTWVFSPGELGPRNMGYTEVTLDRNELGPDYENNIFTR